MRRLVTLWSHGPHGPRCAAPRAAAFLAAVLAVLAVSFAARGEEGVAIGAVVEPFVVLDERFLPRPFTELGAAEAYVFVFVTCDCPIARRYLPRIKVLEERFRARGARFALVGAGPGESVLDLAALRVEHDLPIPVLKDREGAAAAALGVTRSPEAVVLDGGRRLCYRGRIDGQYRFGGERRQESPGELELALEAVLAGREVAVAVTPVDGCALGAPAPIAADPGLTWAEHVAPILHRHCVECHQPHGEAPFSLVTWRQARANAAMIAEVVMERRMPPWFGSAATSSAFANHRVLDDAEIRTLSAWVAAGALPGDLERAPEPPPLRTGDWEIGAPDLVIRQTGTTEVPAEGVLPYRYIVLPYVFPRDTWVEAVEIRSEVPAALHHANLAFFKVTEGFKVDNFITGKVPGGDPMQLDPGTAVRIPAWSVLGLECHYVTTGAEERDRVAVGLRFPRRLVQQRLHHAQITNWKFAIPPGAPAHPVGAQRTFEHEVEGVGLFAHMHLRGRDMTFLAHAPGGETETLLVIPSYSFDWQQSYRWRKGERVFPAGTTIEVRAHFDNSAFNPFNPDPAATVKPGLQTADEMMYGFFFYLVKEERLGLRVDPETGVALGD